MLADSTVFEKCLNKSLNFVLFHAIMYALGSFEELGTALRGLHAQANFQNLIHLSFLFFQANLS